MPACLPALGGCLTGRPAQPATWHLGALLLEGRLLQGGRSAARQPGSSVQGAAGALTACPCSLRRAGAVGSWWLSATAAALTPPRAPSRPPREVLLQQAQRAARVLQRQLWQAQLQVRRGAVGEAGVQVPVREVLPPGALQQQRQERRAGEVVAEPGARHGLLRRGGVGGVLGGCWGWGWGGAGPAGGLAGASCAPGSAARSSSTRAAASRRAAAPRAAARRLCRSLPAARRPRQPWWEPEWAYIGAPRRRCSRASHRFNAAHIDAGPAPSGVPTADCLSGGGGARIGLPTIAMRYKTSGRAMRAPILRQLRQLRLPDRTRHHGGRSGCSRNLQLRVLAIAACDDQRGG
jgi:hypothetical protein